MMRYKIFRFLLPFLAITSCVKSEYQQYSFKGDYKFNFRTLSEFGKLCNDKGNIEVVVRGTDPELKLVTDTAGNCTAVDLPYGTYNLEISKPGYGTRRQSLHHMGVEKIEAANLYLIQNSSTKILNYDVSIAGRTITLKGTITHNYTELIYPYDWPGLSVFVSNSPAVSSVNHINFMNFTASQNSSTDFLASMSLDATIFPPGGTAFIVIYGRPKIYSSYFDAETGSSYFASLGSPSEIKSIRVP